MDNEIDGDKTALAAGIGASDDTAVIPDYAPTAHAKYAWSEIDTDLSAASGEPYPRSLPRWGVAIAAVLTAGVAAAWLGTVLYRHEEPVARPSVVAPTHRQAPPPVPPPVHHEAPPPPAATVNEQTLSLFRFLLAKDNMEDTGTLEQIAPGAEITCGYAAAGNQRTAINNLARHSENNLTLAKATLLVRDSIQAFCPQFAD